MHIYSVGQKVNHVTNPNITFVIVRCLGHNTSLPEPENKRCSYQIRAVITTSNGCSLIELTCYEEELVLDATPDENRNNLSGIV